MFTTHSANVFIITMDACNFDADILQMIEQGDVNAFRQVCTVFSPRVYTWIMHAIREDQVAIVAYLHSLYIHKEEAMGAILSEAIGHGACKITQYTLANGMRRIGAVEILHRKQISSKDVIRVVCEGMNEAELQKLNSDVSMWCPVSVVKWLCEHGYTHLLTGVRACEYFDLDRAREIYNVYHEYGIRGEYLKVCNSDGKCKGCLKETVGELWEMDISEFENGIQWLPREMVQDTLAFV